MNDLIQFNKRSRWLPFDFERHNPHHLTGRWHCRNHRSEEKLVVRIGRSSIPCSLRLEEQRTDGVTVFKFSVSIKTRRGWKLIKFFREDSSNCREILATRLTWMPARHEDRALKGYLSSLRSIESSLVTLRVPVSGPLISVLIPVFNSPLEYLAKAIASVRAQTYPRWELCIADDASTEEGILTYLQKEADQDSRVKLIARPKNGHISLATNSALSLASGDWCALLDQDDELSPHAFAAFVRTLEEHPEARLIYTDEDKLDLDGNRHAAYHKPDWMPELLLAQNFISHLGFYRTDRLQAIGGFRVGYEGCQDWDMALRYTNGLPAGQIIHIPFVLYHWRAISGSTAQSTEAKPYVAAAARRTLHAALADRNIQAVRSPHDTAQFRLTFIPAELPPVAIIHLEPGAGTQQLQTRLANLTDYPNLSFVHDDSDGPAYPINLLLLAAERTSADILVVLPSQSTPLDRAWLNKLVGALSIPGVAAAGGHLINAENRIVDGALLLDSRGRARSAFHNCPESEAGYFGRCQLAHNPGGLSLTGMAIRRADLLGISNRLKGATFNDPRSAGWALSQEFRAKGKRVLHIPRVVLEVKEAPDDWNVSTPHHRFDVKTDPSLHRYFQGNWPVTESAPGNQNRLLNLMRKIFARVGLIEKRKFPVIDPSACFTGRDTPSEHALASICHHQDMRYLLSYRYLRGEGVEIGALHFPLPLAPRVTVRYYDLKTREENIRLYPELPAEKIVVTDYVGDGEKLPQIAPESLDFLIANHMLEHCQDVIGTLKLFYSKLRPEGVLFISLPDLRQTFDCRRAPTPYEHLERDHREGPAVSLYSHYRDILNSWSERQSVGVRALNDGSAVPLDETAFHDAVRGTHVNWHFHAWTQAEITEIFLRLRRDHCMDWEIEANVRNGIEIITVIRKTTVESYDRNEPEFRPLEPIKT